MPYGYICDARYNDSKGCVELLFVIPYESGKWYHATECSLYLVDSVIDNLVNMRIKTTDLKKRAICIRHALVMGPLIYYINHNPDNSISFRPELDMANQTVPNGIPFDLSHKVWWTLIKKSETTKIVERDFKKITQTQIRNLVGSLNLN